MVVLEVKDLRKKFNKKDILKGVSFSLHRGEIFGFVGHNGAGKSTTMKIIMDFIKPSGGDVLIFGKPNTSEDVKRRVGFLAEHPNFYTNVTGTEFLTFVELLSADRKDFWNRVEYYSDLLSIDWALEKKLGEYSKGMLQRFGILQAVVLEPDLLILDEPMSGLDPVGRSLVMELILKLKSEGKTIFFSTHILPDVERVCDRVGVMVNGKLTDILTGNEVRDIEKVFNARIEEEGLREVR